MVAADPNQPMHKIDVQPRLRVSRMIKTLDLYVQDRGHGVNMLCSSHCTLH